MFNKKYSPYLFTAPFMLMFLAFWVWPIIQSALWSLRDWDGMRAPKFVGLANYVALFRDPDFVISLRNTVAAAVVYIALLVLLAILIAIVLNSSRLWGRTVFRSAFFIPVTVSLPVVALIFMLIYAPHNGILNKILAVFGAPPETNWLGNPKTALGSIVALRLWRASGYYSVFVLAGLQAIPRETVEASLIDGASGFQTGLHVILPQLKPVLVYVAIASSVWAFQLFEEPWILTGGGPNNATSTVGIHIYQNGFKFFRLGYASASAYLLAMVILGFSLLQLSAARERRAE